MNSKGQDHGEFLRCFCKKFVLMLQRNALPPSSGRLNLVSVVSGMTGRRECVHYVAVLGTIGQGLLSRCSDTLRAVRIEGRIPGCLTFPRPNRPVLWPILPRTQLAPGLSLG